MLVPVSSMIRGVDGLNLSHKMDTDGPMEKFHHIPIEERDQYQVIFIYININKQFMLKEQDERLS